MAASFGLMICWFLFPVHQKTPGYAPGALQGSVKPQKGKDGENDDHQAHEINDSVHDFSLPAKRASDGRFQNACP